MDRKRVERWLAGYERAWRTAGTDGLGELFTPDVEYVPSPWAEPLGGLLELGAHWESERDGPDEEFAMKSDVLAVEMETAVVRVDVEYGSSGRAWRNLWVLAFSTGGRCSRFEEWPFAPGQADGHQLST